MKFDFVIGNPPYQEMMEGTSDNPVYDKFFDASFEVSNKVELITPARFLFNAGKTPKTWNAKMLEDEHYKVLYYEQVSGKVFPGTDIKGGVAITYYDSQKTIGPIGTFTSYGELNSILKKVNPVGLPFSCVADSVYAPESYKFTDVLYQEHPEILEMTISVKGKEVPLISKGHNYDLTSNILDKLNNIVFFTEKPNDSNEYIRILGLLNKKREYMWIRKDYIREHDNLNYYKVILPKSNGSGAIGEVLSTPLVGTPLVGHTQSFISIGKIDNSIEADNLLKYIKSKFARTMLGILKITQDNKKDTWKYVPMQDFSENSDIDWSVSIADIDRQLYKKYGLSQEEINFIETNVKEMV